jgi:hypothetical protein
MHGSTLKELDFSYNMDVPSAGWRMFVVVLSFPNIALEKLSLCHNHISNHLMVPLSDLLVNNKMLRELSIGSPDSRGKPDIIYGNLAAFTRILYDTSSILNTYNSNHTVEKLCNEEVLRLSNDFMYLLRISKENSNSQAARIKVIIAHFSGSNIRTEIFTAMEFNVLLIAIMWMGQGGGGSVISDGLFSFLRSMQSVCDTKSKNKKRKLADSV